VSVRTLLLAGLLGGAAAAPAATQDPPAAAPRRPVELFQDARGQITDGRYELAAEILKDFLAANPTDQDYLDIEGRVGPQAFLGLRNIPRWYDDPKRDDEFKRGPLLKIVEAARAASEKLVTDPARITRFVSRLGGVREERDFAINELRRSRAAAVPFLIDSLKTDASVEQRAGVYTAVSTLGPETVPAVLAAAENLPDELRGGLLRAVAGRADIGSLVTKTDTNPLPLAWYLSGLPAGQPSAVRETAVEVLAALVGPVAERRTAEGELVRFAQPLYDRKGQFVSVNPDPADPARKNNKLVRAWVWDPAAGNVRPLDLEYWQAEEWYGLKWLRWAVERNPDYAPARRPFVALATERAVQRAKFAELAVADPGAYRLLAATPGDLLVGLLNDAIAENRTGLAYGLVQALGDRGERSAGTSPDPATRTPALAKALGYPDPRVQFAAAVALLRLPPGVTHGANARVVEVLARTLAGDPVAPPNARGKVIIADPFAVRADEITVIVRRLGYQTEQVGTGRELVRRMSAATDVDLVLVDRHIANPTLPDTLAQLRGNPNVGRRAVLVVASTDDQRPISAEAMLLRMALLVAATETLDTALPPFDEYNRRLTPEENAARRRENAADRERALRNLYAERLARLQRLVRAADMAVSPAVQARLDLRLPQLTYAALVSEFALTPETAPTVFRDYRQANEFVARQGDASRAMAAAPTDRLARLIQQLEQALTPALSQKFEALRAKTDPVALGIPRPPAIDLATEEAVRRAVRPFPDVKIIPEPFAATTEFAAEIQEAFADPAQQPRSVAEKRAAAKAAVEWLRRMAAGEIPGYDVRPAEPALRQAAGGDELAVPALDALSHIPTANAQTDLVNVALAPGRPAAIRLQAADSAVRHVQANGPLVRDRVIDVPPNDPVELRARLLVLRTLLGGGRTDLFDQIKGYVPAAVAPAVPPKGKEPAPEPKEGEKKENPDPNK
jgi:CheY-like chemotaxis protein